MLRKKIVKMYYQGESPKSLCEYYSIPKSTLYIWIYQFPEKRRNSKYLAPSTEYNNLVKRTAKLEHEREILQSFIAGLDLSQKAKYEFMDEIYGQYNIHEICNAMQVNRATYYNHLKAKIGSPSMTSTKHIYPNRFAISTKRAIRPMALNESGLH